jgi:hypothetical protein
VHGRGEVPGDKKNIFEKFVVSDERLRVGGGVPGVLRGIELGYWAVQGFEANDRSSGQSEKKDSTPEKKTAELRVAKREGSVEGGARRISADVRRIFTAL